MSTTRTTAYRNHNNNTTYISGGANYQDGNLKLYVCNTCRREVVWATSTRTGRKYLANVYQGESNARYYVKASAHECKPALDIPAGPNESLIRHLKLQLTIVEPMVEEAFDEGDTELYEKLRARKTKLRQQIREIEEV